MSSKAESTAPSVMITYQVGVMLDGKLHTLPPRNECPRDGRVALDGFRKQMLHAALLACHGNKCRAARMLRLHRNTLQRWCTMPFEKWS